MRSRRLRTLAMARGTGERLSVKVRSPLEFPCPCDRMDTAKHGDPSANQYLLAWIATLDACHRRALRSGA